MWPNPQESILLPGSRTQRYLGWLVFVGTFVSCFGCYLGFRNDITSMRIFLILGEIILVPLFIYLIYARSVASRKYKARVKKREALMQNELDALGNIEGIVAPGDASAETNDDTTPGSGPSQAVDPRSPAAEL